MTSLPPVRSLTTCCVASPPKLRKEEPCRNEQTGLLFPAYAILSPALRLAAETLGEATILNTLLHMHLLHCPRRSQLCVIDRGDGCQGSDGNC